MKIKVILVASLLLALLPIQAHATEPSINVTVSTFPLGLKNKGYACTGPTSDNTSGGTEVWYQCTTKTATVYIHGNKLHPNGVYEGFASYIKFVATTSAAYSDLEWMGNAPIAGKDGTAAYKWVTANYKKAKSGQKLTKVFGGVKYTLTGGTGQIRSLEMGVKPTS